MHNKHVSWFSIALFTAASSYAQDTTRVNVDSNGAQANSQSFRPSISGDGRYVAFESLANNLVPNDTNGRDVFVRDRVAQTTMRASVSSAGVQADAESSRPVISRDGRFVAFSSAASNLDPIKTNFTTGAFVRDLLGQTTELVSVGPTGLSSLGNCLVIDISADGNFVLFKSTASDLVAGDNANSIDLFLRDRAAGITESFTVGKGGIDDAPFSELEASISDDGRYVAYLPGNTHAASVRDRLLGTTTAFSKTLTGATAVCEAAVVSSDGSTLAFETFFSLLPQDPNNGTTDIYVCSVATGQLEFVSRNDAGSAGNGNSANPSISADGRFVFFQSAANNLVPGDTNAKADGFMHDRLTHKTFRVSDGAAGQQGNGTTNYGSLRADGLEVAFDSLSTNLVAGDTNAFVDIFVRSLTSPATSANYGAGFPGTGGAIPALTLSAPPTLGANRTLFIGNSAGVPTQAVLAIGFTQVSVPTTALGTLLVDPLLVVFVPVPLAGASVPVTVPNDPTICGPSEFMQAIEQDAGAAAGLSFSAGLAIHPGS